MLGFLSFVVICEFVSILFGYPEPVSTDSGCNNLQKNVSGYLEIQNA